MTRLKRKPDRKYLLHFKDTPCECCGRNDGTTVPAHFRYGQTGGVGLKPPDSLTAGLCFECHSYADQHPKDPHVWFRVLQKMMRDRYMSVNSTGEK